MQIFKRVAELESFTKAADSLGLPKASISNSIQQLETLIGVQLLHRTTRKVQLTHDGIQYYDRCRELLSDFEEVESMFQRGGATVTGRLRIDLPSRFAKDIVIPKLGQFLEKYPQLEIELSATDRRVDVIREGFDCVLRIGTLSESGLIARHVGSLEIINCASPAYLAKFGVPKTLEELDKHRLIHYVPTLGHKSEGWEVFENGECRNIKMRGALTVNNSDAYLAACMAGLGFAQIPAIGAQKEIAKGLLVQVLSEHRAEPMPVSILYPHRRNLARRVQVLIDWLAELILAYAKEVDL